MKKYTIIGGVNGAGKSSLTGVLCGSTATAILPCRTDMFQIG